MRWRRPPCSRSRAAFPASIGKCGRTGRRTIHRPALRSLAEAACRAREKFRWPIAASCSDELPEFDKRVLEVLREPLETGHITISRAARQADFPARFQLIAAMNPCPCDYLGHASGKCRCTPDNIARYQDRISGPLLDRIDMQIQVGAVAADTLSAQADGEASGLIAQRVELAYHLQMARQEKTNQRLGTREIDQHCRLDAAGEQLLRSAMTRLHWSARAYHRVLKVARTIADLAACRSIAPHHVAEAIQYRRALRER